MPPRHRSRLLLAFLAWACVLVGAAWALQWWLEGRVLSGQRSPQAALALMQQWNLALRAALGLTALGLAASLLRLWARVGKTRHWPPGGPWPVPRPLGAQALHRLRAGLFIAAVVAFVLGALALGAALRALPA